MNKKSSYQKLKHKHDIYRQYIIELEYIIYYSQNKKLIDEVKNIRQKYQKLIDEVKNIRQKYQN